MDISFSASTIGAQRRCEQMDLIRARPPNAYVMCVSKVAHALTRFTTEHTSLDIKAGRGMRIAVRVNLPPGVKQLNPYEMAVYAAVQSLYAVGNEAFTIPMVCRAMCGNLSATNLSDKIKCEVSEAIRTLMATNIRIDAKAQADKYQMKRTVYDDTLLHLEPIMARNDCGQPCLHYRFVEPPVLYEYSMAIKHVHTYPMDAVHTQALNNTHEAIVMRYCLLRHIAIILRSGRNDRIVYDTLWEEAGCADTCKGSKALRSKRRKQVKCILQHLVNTKIIAGYDEYKLYRNYVGVIIKTP